MLLVTSAWNYSGWVRIFLGEHQSAIDRFERALRLSPRDPTVFHMRTGIAYGPGLARRITGLSGKPGACGKLEEAREAVDRILQLDPVVRISNLKDRISPLRPEDFAKYADALRKAGLPE